MDKDRALEIASSPVMANVTYHGSPIYIDSVNDNSKTANIHFLNKQKNLQEISLINLQEH
ncbi:H-type small acid-soluble spore protein [Clostridium beijerinckii]|nr:H-type small acid-soluble spore protein [Clostridium beijerinckii]